MDHGGLLSNRYPRLPGRFAHRHGAVATRAAVITMRTFLRAPGRIPVRRPAVFSRLPAR